MYNECGHQPEQFWYTKYRSLLGVPAGWWRIGRYEDRCGTERGAPAESIRTVLCFDPWLQEYVHKMCIAEEQDIDRIEKYEQEGVMYMLTLSKPGAVVNCWGM
jgi:hypothetical protein